MDSTRESTVFYSWQSDLPNRTNRSLIQTALEKAAKSVACDETIAVEPRVDHDTKGVAGSPDIASTILAKIDSADVAVFDVSITSRPEEGRATPNPNVLLELGYALKSLSAQQVVMVFNTATGRIEELPFDLRFKRALMYHAPEETEDLAGVRAGLHRDLKRALEIIYDHLSGAVDPSTAAFFWQLSASLQSVADAAAEAHGRRIKPWLPALKTVCASAAVSLRNLALDDVAVREDLGGVLLS